MAFRFETRHILLNIPLLHIPHLVLQPRQLHFFGSNLGLDLILRFSLGDLVGFEIGEFLFVLLN
jgi:hypothetical protein